MEWPWEWNLSWSGIGAMLGIVIALASLVVSFLSHRASERSARASEDSATAAKQSVAIQRGQWQETKEARLYVQYWRGGIGVSPPPGIRPVSLKVRNEGGGPAFDLRAMSFTSNPKMMISSISGTSTLGPSEETELHFQMPNPFVESHTFFWEAVISYRDGIGDHRLRLVHRLDSPSNPSSTATRIVLASALLDDSPHFQHPSDAGTGWLALPEDT